MASLQVVVDGSLYVVILRRLAAWWSLGSGSCLTPERVVTCAAVEAWL